MCRPPWVYLIILRGSEMSIEVTVLSEVSALWWGCFFFCNLSTSREFLRSQTQHFKTAWPGGHNHSQAGKHSQTDNNKNTDFNRWPHSIYVSFHRVLRSQQKEVSPFLHWLIGEWISYQLCLSNSTQFPTLLVYFCSLCNLKWFFKSLSFLHKLVFFLLLGFGAVYSARQGSV